MADRLGALPEGEAVLRAAQAGDRAAALAGLAALARRTDLPGALHHHLALVFLRQARGEPEHHPAAWGLAWGSWLSFLASPDAPADAARELLLDHLFALCRRRVNDLMARSAFDPARLCWEAVQSLPAVARDRAPALADDLTARVARFRDDLATEYLVTTREAMGFGEGVEGLRANYDRGLALLRRLLSLDGENVRLLTALVETCNEWFLDLYHLRDMGTLREQLDRFTPFALQLNRLVAGQPGQVAARSALSDFCKVRGFMEGDPGSKAALYREALELNPANENVRDLLAALEEPEGSDE